MLSGVWNTIRDWRRHFIKCAHVVSSWNQSSADRKCMPSGFQALGEALSILSLLSSGSNEFACTPRRFWGTFVAHVYDRQAAKNHTVSEQAKGGLSSGCLLYPVQVQLNRKPIQFSLASSCQLLQVGQLSLQCGTLMTESDISNVLPRKQSIICLFERFWVFCPELLRNLELLENLWLQLCQSCSGYTACLWSPRITLLEKA